MPPAFNLSQDQTLHLILLLTSKLVLFQNLKMTWPPSAFLRTTWPVSVVSTIYGQRVLTRWIHIICHNLAIPIAQEEKVVELTNSYNWLSRRI